MDFIGNTVTENPKIASSYIAGKTDEGRDLKVIVLNPTVSSTRSIWIGKKIYFKLNLLLFYYFFLIKDCGIHAVSILIRHLKLYLHLYLSKKLL